MVCVCVCRYPVAVTGIDMCGVVCVCVCRYPVAVTGIDMCGVVYDWLKSGSLDTYLISHTSQWPPPVSVFMEITC